MLTIALTGADGLVGSRIIELLSNDFVFIPLSHGQMDITDKNRVNKTLKDLNFDLFLHLAAYTQVDKAEKEKDLAFLINGVGTKNLFESVLEKNKKFIYFSTDFVFDGKNPPYFEDSQPNPLGIYAASKYEGEIVVGNKGMIVRISYPYRVAYDKKMDFVRNIKEALSQGKKLNMIEDALFTPTFIDDIAYGLKYLFNNYSPEIYHLVGAQSLSPYEAGKLIAETFGLNQDLVSPISFSEYSKGRAPRSQYSEIKSKKNTFQTMKSFSEGLSQFNP